MRRLTRLACVLACCATAALAQRSFFYWVGEAGAATAAGESSFRAGLTGGGEIAIAKGFSAGPEMGFLTPRHHFNNNVAGLAAANGFYHFQHGKRALDPYVSAGYSALFRDGHINFFNYGGGLNYWVNPTLAVRAEFRDRVNNSGPTLHLWTFRLGVSFTRLFP